MKKEDENEQNQEEESADEFLDFDFGDEDWKDYFDYNREEPNAIYVDEKENAIDSLETALQVLDRKDNLKWKWFVFALHHSLYSFCISSLENGNYENVLQKSWNSDNDVYFQKGSEQKLKKSEIVPFYINEYKTPAYRIKWIEVDSFPERDKKGKASKREKLISFWSGLARVQDNYCWMGSMSGQRGLEISDEELKKICWLVEQVRNDLTHFIPKGYAISIIDIIEASEIIVKEIEFLALESYAILFLNYEKSTKRINDALKGIKEKLKKEKQNITGHETAKRIEN